MHRFNIGDRISHDFGGLQASRVASLVHIDGQPAYLVRAFHGSLVDPTHGTSVVVLDSEVTE